jgi:hypothetical protein
MMGGGRAMYRIALGRFQCVEAIATSLWKKG